MSPASRSKSKDKRAASKEPQKSSAKPTTNANTVGGIPASGYNPLLGTFHTLETAPASSAPPVHANGRFRNIDETDDPSGNSVGEYDSVSNNGSCSGESEDPKDKTSQGPSRQDAAVPGVDSDKREKIRQKNEKKHQRQKERRAQELHERCSDYLMSRKLESLAQQLVAMGFPSERATMALILNEGRIEESVAWLFEGGEDNDNQREHSLDGGGNGNVKVDISEELARIAAMEIKFKCSKQEVERAVVACEGDLEQAAETLMKTQKPESPGGDPPTIGGSGKPSVTNSQSSSASRVPSKRMPIQQKTDDRDFNYTKMAVPVPVPVPLGRISMDPASKNIQLLKKTQSNSDWAKPQQAAAQLRWPVGGSKSNPPVSYSLSSPLQAAPPPLPKTEPVGNELKNLQLGSVREPVIVMQRPQSKHIPAIADWNSSGVEQVTGMNPNGLSHIATTTRSFNTSSYGSNTNSQMYNQFSYHQQQPPLPQQHYMSNGGLFDPHGGQPGGMNHLGNNGMWNRATGPTPTLAAASSLGLFSGGATGMSHVDWNADGASQFDYTNIDWSLNRLPTPSGSSRPNGLWVGSQARAVLSNGLHPDGAAAGSEPSGGGGSREWSSPFEEKDLFSLPRQFVSSPSL